MMSQQVGGVETTLLDEPHLAGHRVSVRRIHALVEERGDDPQAVADSLGIGLGSVYRALAYYHDNPGEMHAVERRRTERIESSRAAGAVTGPDDL
jgi:uncharacterized protein (DUF433 family)